MLSADMVQNFWNSFTFPVERHTMTATPEKHIWKFVM